MGTKRTKNETKPKTSTKAGAKAKAEAVSSRPYSPPSNEGRNLAHVLAVYPYSGTDTRPSLLTTDETIAFETAVELGGAEVRRCTAILVDTRRWEAARRPLGDKIFEALEEAERASQELEDFRDETRYERDNATREIERLAQQVDELEDKVRGLEASREEDRNTLNDRVDRMARYIRKLLDEQGMNESDVDRVLDTLEGIGG